uniref:Uncharacterized LOC115576412 n=1 Tax=Sparus aurata TaxID=8175 RepID=A0A671WK44_SPAAU
MSPWQLLRASRATQAAVGYRVHHASGGSVHYSTAPVAADAPDSSRSFCLSTEKATMQQLNSRLASYLQQVQYLEAANQKLECQIQEELDKKCPVELRELDGHLRTVSLLQDQISDCLSAQAQVKLQLLSAELTIFDLNVRTEKEHERRGCLEAELNDLRLLKEELQVHKLPEIQSLLNDQSQQLMGLQIQHQQDMQVVLSQMSGGVTVEMQPAETLDLIQQLDDLRHTSVALLDKNQNEHWFNTQVSMLSSPEVTFDPPAESEVIQAELEELRRTAESLEEELRQLHSLNMVLEATGLDQNESFVEQLEVLQQRADSLCWDLDSVLQATAQQAADQQTLLDITTRLETEIQDYRRLLDGLSPKRVSSLHPTSVANVTSFCGSTSPSPLRRNFTVNKTASVQGGSLKMTGVHAVSRGHIYTVGQTPIGAPLSETVTTVHAIRVHRQYPHNTPVTSINTSNWTSSFQKSENQRTAAIPERTINRQSSPVEDKNHDLRNSSIVSTQVRQGIDQRVAVKDSKLVTNTAQGIIKLFPETQSVGSAEVQAKPEAFTSKPTSLEAVLQANKTETNIQTEITRTILCAEPEVKQGSHSLTHTTTTDNRKKETETVVSAEIICTDRSLEAKNQHPAEVVSLSVKTPTEAVRDEGEIVVRASIVSDFPVLRCVEAQAQVSGDMTLEVKRQEKKQEEDVVRVEGTLLAPSEENKVLEDTDTGSSIATASSSSPHSNDNVESKTTEGTITLVPETESVRSATIQAKPDTLASKEPPREADFQVTKTETYTQTVITKTLLCAEPEVKQGPNTAHTTINDSSKKTAAELKKETQTMISAQMNCTEGSIQAKNQESAQVMSLKLTTPTKIAEDERELAVKETAASESQILVFSEAQCKVSGDLTRMDNKKVERQERNQEEGAVEVECNLLVPSEENKVTTAPFSSPDNKENLESKTTQGTIALDSDTQSFRRAAVQAKPETFASEETSTEADLLATKTRTNITSVVSEFQILKSEEAQDEVSGDLTLLNEEVIRQQKKREEEIEGTLLVPSEENTFIEDVDTRSSIATASSSTPDSNVNLESKIAQGTIAFIPDTQYVRSVAVQAKPETFESKETSTEADFQVTKTGTNIQTVITRTLLCAGPEVKQGPDLLYTAISDPSKQTAAEAKKEAETVISSKINCTEGSIEAKNQESPQLVSLSLETQTEAVGNGGVGVRASVFPESQILRSEGAQGKVSCDLTVMDNKEVERQELKGEVVEVESTLLVPSLEQSLALSDASKSELNKVIEDAETGPSSNPDSNDFESKTASTERLRKVESEVDKGNVVIGFHDTNKVKDDSTKSDNQSKKCTGEKDSGVALSSSVTEELLNPREVHVSASSTKPDIHLSLVEKELLMSTTDQVFRPVDPKEHIRSPDSLSSPNDLEQCFSLVEANMCLSPNGEEEDGEVSLSLTEANAVVRPVEKYLLSTKEEGEPLSFGKDPGLLEQDRNGKVSISVRDGDNLCIGSFEGSKESRGTVNGTINSKPTGEGISLQLGGTADNNAVQNPGGSPEGRYGSENQKETSKSASFGSIPSKEGTTISSVATNSGSISTSNSGIAASSSSKVSVNAGVSVNAEVEDRFRRGSGELMVYGGILGHKTMSLPKTGSKESLSGATSQQERGRFSSRGSAEWMVHGSSKGKEKGSSGTPNPATNPQEKVRFGSGSSLHRTRSEESTSVPLATSPPEKGRFGSEGSGEWRVYGGSPGRISSWAGSKSLPKANGENIPSDVAKLPTSPPGSQGGGRFGSAGSGGSGEWRVYGGSSGRMSSWPGSNNLPKADREDVTSVAAKLPTSPPGSQGAGRFGSAGSGGSGEWRVYGGSSGRMSSWPGNSNLPKADREEISADAKLVTSPPGSVGRRFGSGGSGEWRVYGGSSGRLSSASGADRVSGTSRNQIISPPSSLTSSGQRLSSVGRLSSGGVVRRSSSVGSGGSISGSGSSGRLSGSSGSHRTSTSGRYASTGSGEWKPVYSSASAHRTSMGSTGRPGAGGATGSQRAPSPGGKMSVSMGSGSSSGSGRTNSTGGRVISSSDWPIRSTGSGTGGNKERISVCKMAALSISAAGRERSQDRQRQQQQQQQQQAAGEHSCFVLTLC